MAKTVFDNGYIIVSARYVSQKADGSFYYQRRVPKGLEKHHGGKTLIRESLGTKSAHVAAKKASKRAAEHDALWRGLRDPSAIEAGLTTRETRDGAEVLLTHFGVKPGEGLGEFWPDHDPLDAHLTERHGDRYLEARHGEHRSDARLEKILTPTENEAMRLAYSSPEAKRRLLSDARDLYLELHNRGDDDHFKKDTTRAIQHVIDTAGDLFLENYNREHARELVKFLSSQGKVPITTWTRLLMLFAILALVVGAILYAFYTQHIDQGAGRFTLIVLIVALLSSCFIALERSILEA